MLFKLKGYNLFRSNIIISIEVLKSFDNTKCFGITFGQTLKDDKDNIWQMRFCMQKVINCYAFLVIVQLM